MKDDYFIDQLRALGFSKEEAKHLFYGVHTKTASALHEETLKWLYYVKRIQLERDLITMVAQGEVYVTYDAAQDNWVYQLANRQSFPETQE